MREIKKGLRKLIVSDLKKLMFKREWVWDRGEFKVIYLIYYFVVFVVDIMWDL